MMADAVDCVLKARELGYTAYLPDIHAKLASFCLQTGSINDATRHYESALALDSHHTASLVGLGTIELQRAGGSPVLSNGYLTQALQIDATSHSAWYEMGL